MKIIFKAADVTEAHIIAGLLNANDIETYVGGHYQQGGIGELAPSDFAQVSVNEDDISKAEEIVRQYRQQQPEASEAKPLNLYKPMAAVVVVFVLLLIVYLFLQETS